MNKIIILLVYLTQTINLFAQPGDEPVFINEIAYSKPFLHLVNDEKYFAKYAIEAHNGFFELMEPIKCKLHVPTGINKIWQDAENSNLHMKGEYDYSKDFMVGIRFNFYVGGILVSTAYRNIEKPKEDDSPFTFYFNLDPLNFEQRASDINFAYIVFLKNLKKKGSQLVIEAALSSKNLDIKSYVPIASGSFHLRYDDVKYGEWLKLASDFSGHLKHDSRMEHIKRTKVKPDIEFK